MLARLIGKLSCSLVLLCALTAYAADGNQEVFSPWTIAPACATGKVCVYLLASDNQLYVADSTGSRIKMQAAKSFRTSANCAALASPANGDVCYDTTGSVFKFYAGGWKTAGIDDSLVVHKAGTETITGAKTFSTAIAMSAVKITGLAQGTASGEAVHAGRSVLTSAPLSGGGDLTANRTLSLSYSADMTTAGGSLVLASKVRSTALKWRAASGTTFTANNYWGPSGDTSATSTQVAPIIIPCNGTVTDLLVQSNSNTTGNTVITLYDSLGGNTISYSATTLTCTISSGTKSCSDVSHSYTGTHGHLLLLRVTNSSWTPTGAAANLRIACDST